jgi:ketosteroid isomerase-like protein
MLGDTDRTNIIDVVTRADDAATRRDPDGYVAFFTDDALLDGDKGEYRGKEQLRQSVGPIWESEGSASTHCTMNVVVHTTDTDPHRAIATSLLLILRNGPPVSVASLSFIEQHLIKLDSRWLIERRSVHSNPN